MKLNINFEERNGKILEKPKTNKQETTTTKTHMEAED